MGVGVCANDTAALGHIPSESLVYSLLEIVCCLCVAGFQLPRRLYIQSTEPHVKYMYYIYCTFI